MLLTYGENGLHSHQPSQKPCDVASWYRRTSTVSVADTKGTQMVNASRWGSLRRLLVAAGALTAVALSTAPSNAAQRAIQSAPADCPKGYFCGYKQNNFQQLGFRYRTATSRKSPTAWGVEVPGTTTRHPARIRGSTAKTGNTSPIPAPPPPRTPTATGAPSGPSGTGAECLGDRSQ